MIVQRIISLVIGYVFGMFLSGYMLGKKKDVDIRKQGSGNVGTTNTLRILGMKAGAFTLICDCAKSVLAALVVWLIFRNSAQEQLRLLCFYGCIGTILGHDFPFYMKFKGGKGVASSFGMIIAIFPQAIIPSVIIFVIIVALTRYVSLGSILCAIAFPVQVILYAHLGWLSFPDSNLLEVQILSVLIGGLCIFLHRANIVRLMQKRENKISFHKS